MEAQLIENRDCYEITYDGSTNDGGTITASFENPQDGDKSAYTGLDDGSFIVTVSPGYSGRANCSVTNELGEEIDGGMVTFGTAD